ncbi:MAG: prolipoprotein diacylglyceryl transferase [Planctomycetes bacterium]|nr:prolipoprotein diacylglyceryl transferase [Planctomycetota bacterium]
MMPPGRLSYAIFMLLALAVFLATRRVVTRDSHSPRLAPRERWALTLAAFIGGAFGAKAPFVLAGGVSGLTQGVWLADGKTITTGLAGAYLAVEATKWMLGIHAKTGDAYALPLAAALAIGRWGCFFNGCCYGVPTAAPWGVDFFGDRPRHPTQIYEVLFHAAMAGVLWELHRRDLLRLQRLKLYLIAYFAFRFATEYIRPAAPQALGLTFYQWTAVAMIVGLSVQWMMDERRKIRSAPVPA